MPATVTVSLRARSYPILIGAGLLDDARRWRTITGRRRVLIVTDDNVAPLYLDRVRAAIGNGAHGCVLEAGEAGKSVLTASRVWDALIAARLARDDVLVALGGGVVGDIAGFAAACYQRGIACIQAPTTLIAQVDSAVGGKTGVNHPAGKNMIGAFHQPEAVIADTAALATLSADEYRAGLAEIVKYGAVLDADFFVWLEANLDALMAGEPDALAHAIARSCELKAAVVAADERDQGERALLNFGHTFGHAIETGLGHGRWRHGEAVAAGMVMAATFARRLGRLAENDARRLRVLVERAGLPSWAPLGLDADTLLASMASDKKNRRGRLRLIVPGRIGKAETTSDFDPALLRELLECGPID
jgi:3-dehydroquinate synthase